MGKVRLDIEMFKRGLVNSREKAKALIMAGQVMVDDVKVEKAGTNINSDVRIKILGKNLPYVSRGGLKLEKALKIFPLNIKGKVMADIGASTGGFTDCALQNGVKKVFAIDVGYGQLDWKLRNDPRVISMERTNARYITEEDLQEQVDFISIDVAFISLEKILPSVKKILKDKGEVVALIKPQFEAGKDKVGKKGVVKDPQVHLEVIENIINSCITLDLGVQGLTYSPITGPEGNIEYLIWLKNNATTIPLEPGSVVLEAHENFKREK